MERERRWSGPSRPEGALAKYMDWVDTIVVSTQLMGSCDGGTQSPVWQAAHDEVVRCLDEATQLHFNRKTLLMVAGHRLKQQQEREHKV